jgi:hypothetical protein
MTTVHEPKTHDAAHGLVLDDGRAFANRGLSRSTATAVCLEPISCADVQAAVVDEARFPSRIHPVGSMHSVTSTIVNEHPLWQEFSRADNELTIHTLGATASPTRFSGFDRVM